MIYVLFAYIIAIVVVHILLFTRANYMSKILLINSAISCLAVTMLLLAYYFKDTNFIDVIFFYIIMSPIGFYGIFIYYKNISAINKKKTDMQNTIQNSSSNISKNKIENNKTLKIDQQQKSLDKRNNNNHKNGDQSHKKHNSISIKKQSNHKHKNNHNRTKNAGNKQKNKL